MRGFGGMLCGLAATALLAGCGNGGGDGEAAEGLAPDDAVFMVAEHDPAMVPLASDLGEACGMQERGRHEWGLGIASSGWDMERLGQDGVTISVWSPEAAEIVMTANGPQATVTAPAFISFERQNPPILFASELEEGQVRFSYDGANFTCAQLGELTEPAPCDPAPDEDIADRVRDSSGIFEDLVIEAYGDTPGCVAVNAERAHCRLKGEGVIAARKGNERLLFAGEDGSTIRVKIRGDEITCAKRPMAG